MWLRRTVAKTNRPPLRPRDVKTANPTITPEAQQSALRQTPQALQTIKSVGVACSATFTLRLVALVAYLPSPHAEIHRVPSGNPTLRRGIPLPLRVPIPLHPLRQALMRTRSSGHSRSSPTPPPRPRTRQVHREKTPEHDRDSPTPETLAYENCPTSYEKREGKRGGRVYEQTTGGKRRVKLTAIERLGTRKAKYDHFKAENHPFGLMHECYFNPYSARMAETRSYHRIPRPLGVSAGRGEFQIHEALGCRSDYEFFKEVLGSLRKTLIAHRPRHIVLSKGKGYQWKNYGSASRQKIHEYMYKRYPFLLHFRDESGEDCWAITMLATQYLGSTRSYIMQKKKAERYMRRHPSGKKNHDEDDEEDEGEEEDKGEGEDKDNDDEALGFDLNDYDDDYTENAPVHAAVPNRNQRPVHAAPRQSMPASSSRPPTAQPKSTNRDNRRADKIVAIEEARTATKDSRAISGGSKAALAKAKSKQCEDWPREPTPPEESDEEAPCQVTKKVGAAVRKQQQDSPAEAEQPQPKKRKIMPKIRPVPPPDEETPDATTNNPATPSAAKSSRTSAAVTITNSPADPGPSSGQKGGTHVVGAKKMMVVIPLNTSTVITPATSEPPQRKRAPKK
ncbi:hypothetical protein FRC06_005528 [Ceratobasidium sp. 370]|nr:hypothetical protein FRC06_005528 [Ceratobasidium sp. 370]